MFTAPLQFPVLHGRCAIGRPDPALLTEKIEGYRLLLSGGRSWKVGWIGWKRRRCFVEEATGGGKARWHTPGLGGASPELSRAVRDVLLGSDPPRPSGEAGRTWTGHRANATPASALSDLTDARQRV